MNTVIVYCVIHAYIKMQLQCTHNKEFRLHIDPYTLRIIAINTFTAFQYNVVFTCRTSLLKVDFKQGLYIF